MGVHRGWGFLLVNSFNFDSSVIQLKLAPSWTLKIRIGLKWCHARSVCPTAAFHDWWAVMSFHQLRFSSCTGAFVNVGNLTPFLHVLLQLTTRFSIFGLAIISFETSIFDTSWNSNTSTFSPATRPLLSSRSITSMKCNVYKPWFLPLSLLDFFMAQPKITLSFNDATVILTFTGQSL